LKHRGGSWAREGSAAGESFKGRGNRNQGGTESSSIWGGGGKGLIKGEKKRILQGKESPFSLMGEGAHCTKGDRLTLGSKKNRGGRVEKGPGKGT